MSAEPSVKSEDMISAFKQKYKDKYRKKMEDTLNIKMTEKELELAQFKLKTNQDIQDLQAKNKEQKKLIKELKRQLDEKSADLVQGEQKMKEMEEVKVLWSEQEVQTDEMERELVEEVKIRYDYVKDEELKFINKNLERMLELYKWLFWEKLEELIYIKDTLMEIGGNVIDSVGEFSMGPKNEIGELEGWGIKICESTEN